ncbi:PHD finger protein 20b isoform X2 [Polypterus senegalus]|uniref:PHD finger protein 20b isoform X2 n=1 Tax=Polypterus senegalus TaxID=55291 RepID=UPI001963A3CF|nr:PHD finger protein 20b isoform X2 [Polypterus senegalus]
MNRDKEIKVHNDSNLNIWKMSKKPPNRRGISFEVGAQLEARDSLKNWYSASIEKIDYDEEKVLIHYRQWSHRYDEWFDWDSPYLRPVERVQLRKEGLQAEEGDPEFKVNDKVFASWSDCRFYPARILAVNKDVLLPPWFRHAPWPVPTKIHPVSTCFCPLSLPACIPAFPFKRHLNLAYSLTGDLIDATTYAVKFYDGVIQTVKSIHIKPYKKIGKCKIEDKIVEKSGGKKETVKDDIKHNGTDHTGSHGNIKSKEVSCNVQEKDQGIYRKEVVKKVCFKRASHENSKWAKLKAEMPINVKQESVEHPKRIRLASDEHSKKTRLFPDDHFKRVRRVSVQHFKKARQVSKKYSKRPWIVTEKHSKPILCTSKEHCKNHETISQEISKRPHYTSEENSKRTVQVLEKACNRTKPVSEKDPVKAKRALEEEADPVKAMRASEEEEEEDPIKARQTTEEKNPIRARQASEEKDSVRGRRSSEGKDPVRGRRCSVEKDTIRARQTTDGKDPVRVRQTTDEKDPVRVRRALEDKNPLRSRRLSGEISRKAKNTSREDPRRAERALRKEPERANRGEEPKRARRFRLEDPKRTRRVLRQGPKRTRRVLREGPKGNRRVLRKCPKGAKQVSRKDSKGVRRGSQKTAKGARQVSQKGAKGARQLSQQGLKETRRVLRDGPKGVRQASQEGLKRARQFTRKNTKVDRRETDTNYDNCNNEFETKRKRTTFKVVDDCKILYKDAGFISKIKPKVGKGYVIRKRGAGKVLSKNMQDLNKDSLNQKSEKKADKREQEAGLVLIKAATENDNGSEESNEGSKIDSKILKQENTANDEKIADAPNGIIKGNFKILDEKSNKKMAEENLSTEMVEVNIGKDLSNSQILAVNRELKREEMLQHGDARLPTVEHNANDCSISKAEIPLEILKEENRELTNDGCQQKIVKVEEVAKIMKEKVEGSNVEIRSQQQEPSQAREKKRRGRPPLKESTGNQHGILELRKRKITWRTSVSSKRLKFEARTDSRRSSQISVKEHDPRRRRSSRFSLNSSESEDVKHTLETVENKPEIQVESGPKLPVATSQAQLMPEEVKNELPDLHQENADHLQVSVNELKQQENEEKPKESSNVLKKTEPVQVFTETSPVIKRHPSLPNPNKYSREPLYSGIKRTQDVLSTPALAVDLDHNTFKCKVEDCLKSFRKAKLLHYHMKYYHGVDKANEIDQSPKRNIHTRASEKQAVQENHKRRRTISSSLHIALHTTHGHLPNSQLNGKAAKVNDKRRTSAPPLVQMLNNHRPSLREKSKENQLEKSNRKLQEKEKVATEIIKEKEKFKEKKHRDFLRIKLKKKKKKKKKSKSEEDSLSNSSTDSLFWSEEEFSQEVDVTTNPDEDAPDEDDQCHEIVRCICEVQEENDFMIQCEECLCWQHGVCMGLLEHNVPERYTCYICRDPPGQRQSLKYWYDKEWLSSGHMYGLPFLEENYSHQNGKKIAATHQLLGDVQKVIEVLNGLQLKISILHQAHPDLKLWCQSWKHIDCKDKPRKKQPPLVREENDDQERSMVCWSVEEVNVKPCIGPCIQESYITSEHCYQKPRTYYPAMEQRLVVETRGAELDDRTQIIRENVDDFLILDHGRYSRSMDQERSRRSCESYLETTSLQEMEGDVSKKSFSEEEFSLNLEDGEVQQQWQINLLDHIEAVQDEVTHRMDFIEKELDVLESWLDYTGELEPPEPLARLPQLKHRIKQLLTELGKIQEIALCCST